MKRFQFKLHSVLKVKKVLEAQKKKAFAEIQQEVATREQEKQRHQQEIQNVRRELVKLQQSEIDMGEVLSYQRYQNSLKAAVTRLESELVPLRREAEKRRLALVEAAKERRALEKLRDKQEQEWKVEQDRKEAKQLDEMGLIDRKLTPDGDEKGDQS